MGVFKLHLPGIQERLRVLWIVAPLRGFNNSTQYASRLAYRSVITGQDEYIKIEVSVREPVVEPSVSMPARTLLVDPFRREPAVGAVNTTVLTRREAFSEKVRAALSRRETAIRDFFDLHHAIAFGIIDTTDSEFLALVKQKLLIPGNDPIDMSMQKLENLREQLESQLEPVLRHHDYSTFDLEMVFEAVEKIAVRLGEL